MQVDSSDYHPATPDSPLTSSLDHVTSTIDDLMLALTNFSRVPSPEPQRQLCCCCGSEECEATKAWTAFKSKLESRLVLSAEVGSALLQRHEAYVRRHELSNSTLQKATQNSSLEVAETGQAELDIRVGELLRENAVLEKRLSQALLNSEVVEGSNKTLQHELEEARSAVSKLSIQHARTVGLDTRLSAVLQDNDDIRQERDSQSQRAKLAEARLAALINRTDHLQAQVHRLQDDLEIRRLQRIESSGSLLQDARSRLKGLQISCATTSATKEDSEVTKVIESLVVDNEMLKADNEELHKLLTESREDLQTLQREMGEQSIAPPIQVATPSRYSRPSSGPSSFAKDSLFSSARRPSSVESRARRTYEPLTPETGRRPLSPAESLSASASSYANLVHPQPRLPPPHLILDTDTEAENDQEMLNQNQATKAVQTDRFLSSHGIGQVTSPFIEQSSVSPNDGHSDCSSSFDGVGSPISSLLERMHSLLCRMIQADALTLTKRLKRQHLRGADIKHLSRTTVGGILSDISHLRAQYRVWLEDDKITTLCTRKDLRGLFRLFKEVLEEMGQMRVTLNDIILEPTIAAKISEVALDPAKVEAMVQERKAIGIGIGASWITPFSKLFSSPLHDMSLLPSATRTLQPTNSGHGNIRVSRSVPKLSPALAATATTVNVEFSGTGSGKSVTSVFSAHPDNDGTNGRLPGLRTLPQSSPQSNIRNVMDIFAGALHPDDISDPWVVLPRTPQRSQSSLADPAEAGASTIGRSMARKRKTSFSRDVDAILDAPPVFPQKIKDSEARDVPSLLVERSLRRRGLSDSSIHSTFMNQGGSAEESARPEPDAPWLDRASVLRTISRTVHNFKQAASHTISGVSPSSTFVPPQPSAADSIPGPPDSYITLSNDNPNIPHSQLQRPSVKLNSLIPSLTSWTAAGVALESTHHRNSHSGFRDDAGISRLFGREV